MEKAKTKVMKKDRFGYKRNKNNLKDSKTEDVKATKKVSGAPGGDSNLKYPVESDRKSSTLPVRTAPSQQKIKNSHASKRRDMPRRHTLGGVALKNKQTEEAEDPQDLEKKRDAFLDLLAKRYPNYANKISSSASDDGITVREKPKISAGDRRRTTVVTYNPKMNRSVEYDDNGPMSEVDSPQSRVDSPQSNFQRGGFQRSSLPIVRNNPSTYDTTIGLVFLIFRDETKKALLPNEITHLDTVRALFVRSFPEKIHMKFMDSPKRKIYILEPRTNIYYQLEDLKDIKERTVLKIHECESSDPQKVKEYPEVRGKTVMSPPPRSQSFHGDEPSSSISSHVNQPISKTHSLPPQSSPAYRQIMEDQRHHERPITPDILPLRPQVYTRQPDQRRMSPDRHTPERQFLGPIPENRQLPPQMVANGVHHHPDHRKSYPSSSNHHHQQQQGPFNPAASYQQPNASSSSYYQHPATQGYGQAQAQIRHPQARRISPQRRHSDTGLHHRSHSAADQADRVCSPTPGQQPQMFVAKSMRTSAGISPQRATGPDSRDGRSVVPSNRHSHPFAGSANSVPSEPINQRTQSYRVPPERDAVVQRARSVTPQPSDYETHNRIDKMEEQLANLAAWVHHSVTKPVSVSDSSRSSSTRSESTCTGSSSSTGDKRSPNQKSGMSDIPASVQHPLQMGGKPTLPTKPGHPTDRPVSQNARRPTTTPSLINSLQILKLKAEAMKTDLRGMRRSHQVNAESFNGMMHHTMVKLQGVLAQVPGLECQPLRHMRSQADVVYQAYILDETRVRKNLADLEISVEELRTDVISKQCRVNMLNVEGMALELSNITKALADMKVRFPPMQAKLKQVMSGEMEVVVKEEKFMKDEPENIETSLKRCKKLTGTLFTLKRLASVQETRPPHIPNVATNINPSTHDKQTILENIEAMIPNHDARLQSLEEADASRERKRKLATQQESLKFEKSLELATKALKTIPIGQPAESKLSIHNTDTKEVVSIKSEVKVSLPLTITTEKISNIGNTVVPVSDVMATTQANPISTIKIDEKPPVPMTTAQRSVARSSFFNALTTPTNLCPISSSLTPPSKAKSMDYTVRISPAKIETKSTSTTVSTVNSSQVSPNSRPNTLPAAVTPAEKVYLTQTTLYSATASPDYAKGPLTSTPITMSDSNSAATGGSPVRSRSVGSNIPRPNASSKPHSTSKPNTPTDPENKHRRVPPPPPPRKSSKTAGTIPVNVSDEPTSTTNNINGISADKGSDIEVTKNMKAKDNSSGQKTSLPISSTPLKSSPAKKPLNRFEKDIVAGIYSNMNRPDLQNQKISHQEIIQRNEGHESSPDGSASVSSESSVDSQQGINGAIKNGSTNKGTKKPRPEPPVRKSSVLSNVNGDANQNNNNNTVVIQAKSIKESTTIKSRSSSHKSGSKPVVATRRKVQETCID